MSESDEYVEVDPNSRAARVRRISPDRDAQEQEDARDPQPCWQLPPPAVARLIGASQVRPQAARYVAVTAAADWVMAMYPKLFRPEALAEMERRRR